MNPTEAGAPAPPQPPADTDDRLLRDRERALNATDQLMGARAEAAQARAEIRELEYRLHVREAELVELRRLLDQQPGAGRPMGKIAAGLRSTVDRLARGAGGR